MSTTTSTEIVSPLDLKVGDVITGIDGTEFPFPFTLTRATNCGGLAMQVAAEHGWFGVLMPHFQVRRVVAG